ncbi:hypothetical protein DID75_03775 [Candidatus Marinamargulisbacteria bacterium SCGC AG-410-N11]|nr:hypothetical protein DID75_03775 [Candidatus Marinamargulisbacteria bacterium SCGC AG-410-N11]
MKKIIALGFKNQRIYKLEILNANPLLESQYPEEKQYFNEINQLFINLINFNSFDYEKKNSFKKSLNSDISLYKSDFTFGSVSYLHYFSYLGFEDLLVKIIDSKLDFVSPTKKTNSFSSSFFNKTNMLTKKDSKGQNIVHWAIKGNQKTLYSVLESKFDIQNDEKYNYLLFSINENEFDIASHIFKNLREDNYFDQDNQKFLEMVILLCKKYDSLKDSCRNFFSQIKFILKEIFSNNQRSNIGESASLNCLVDIAIKELAWDIYFYLNDSCNLNSKKYDVLSGLNGSNFYQPKIRDGGYVERYQEDLN